MSIYVAVVSHGHFELIKKLDSLTSLIKAENVKIAILDNVQECGFEAWCRSHGISYLCNIKPRGFGENNNIIFDFFQSKTTYRNDDHFCVLNPDVIVRVDDLTKVIATMKSNHAKIAAINLFKDSNFNEPDNSIRKFPYFYDFISSFLLKKNPTIIVKEDLNKPAFVDWAAGSFLCFSAFHYSKLGGFDTEYFMYCEDLDICYRSNFLFEEKVLFCPDVKAVHLAQHANRSIFSEHFRWHVKSIIRFLKKRWTGTE